MGNKAFVDLLIKQVSPPNLACWEYSKKLCGTEDSFRRLFSLPLSGHPLIGRSFWSPLS